MIGTLVEQHSIRIAQLLPSNALRIDLHSGVNMTSTLQQYLYKWLQDLEALGEPLVK